LSEPVRLSKAVAALVPCTRREAEQYIVEGRVRVDGAVVDEPQSRVSESQRIEVDRQARLQPQVAVTVLLHKPAGMDNQQALALFAADAQWSGDTSGLRRVKGHSVGLVSLLPLPREASGLAVFSQNPGVVRKLQEDAAFVEQELVVDVSGTIAPDGLARLARGLQLEGTRLPPAHVSWQSERRLRFAAKGIPPEWVPRMCDAVGLQVTALRRLRIGRVAMAGLPAGQWRFLPAGERF
jgi:23S rRNA pseudouridine2604 synthase